MNSKSYINLNRAEAIRRYVIGAILIQAVLIAPNTVPGWVALFACYPIFTALMQWDPINSLFETLFSKTSKSIQEGMFPRSISNA